MRATLALVPPFPDDLTVPHEDGADDRIEVATARAEGLARDSRQRGRWPVVTAWAVASTADLVELAFPLLTDGGRLVAWKRGDLGDELAAALVEHDLRVRIYCPVGDMVAGMAYLVRRLLENTSNESFLGEQQRGTPIEQLLAAP